MPRNLKMQLLLYSVCHDEPARPESPPFVCSCWFGTLCRPSISEWLPQCGHSAPLPTGKQGVYKANYGYLLLELFLIAVGSFDTLKGTFSPATTAVECVYGKLYRNSTEKRHEKAISHMISVEACRYDRIQSIFSITLNIPALPKITKKVIIQDSYGILTLNCLAAQSLHLDQWEYFQRTSERWISAPSSSSWSWPTWERMTWIGYGIKIGISHYTNI